MVDNIVMLEDDKRYVILDEKELDNVRYYYGLRLDDKEEPTDVYLFFKESRYGDDIYLAPVEDEKIKKILLTAFTIDFLDKAYDEV